MANTSHVILSEVKDQPLCFFKKAALTGRFGCYCSIIMAREKSFKDSGNTVKAHCDPPHTTGHRAVINRNSSQVKKTSEIFHRK